MSLNQKRLLNSNISNQIHPQLLKSTNQSNLCDQNKEIQSKLFTLLQAKSQSKNAYEKVIESLQDLVNKLLNKNQYLKQDQEVLLKQNLQLRKKNESLNNVLEVKQRLGESVFAESTDIFQILVEATSESCGNSKIDDSYEQAKAKLQKQEDSSAILNKNQFAISSNPLSYNISVIEENQISMSNIGRTQIEPAQNQTNELSQGNIYIQCSSKKAQGAIRAFYLSLIQRKVTTNYLMKIIQTLKNDITTIIYEPYPSNQFWTEMLCNFLKVIHEGHFETQTDILEYIKLHRLIDTLLIKCLKSRIQFLFYEVPTNQQIFGALANQFGLKLEIFDNQFIFSLKQFKEEYLRSSQGQSLDISGNNKNQKQQQTAFIIHERQQYFQFTFFIVFETQNQLGFSQYQITQEPQTHNHSFQYAQNEKKNNEEVIEVSGGDHLEDIALILNEKNQNIDTSDKKMKDSQKQRYQEPLNSSRFFLNRVGSKRSDFEEFA